MGHDEIAPDQLLANPLNYRIHPAQQQSALSGSLDNLGWIQEVLVNKNTGHVIDGHLRIQLALRNDEKLIPVTYLDLTEDEEKLALLSLDTIAAMAAIDKEQLDNLLTQVNSDDTRIQEFLHNLAEENNLIDDEQGAVDAEPRIEKSDELQEIWQVKPGDLYKIGDHRLLCGDATNRDDVDKLMMGEKADMVFTDPPYGVSYSDKNKYLNELDQCNRILSPIIGDNIDINSHFDQLIYPAFCLIREHITEQSSYYIMSPQGGQLFQFLTAMKNAGLPFRHMLIWVKNCHALGLSDYNYKHESILYGWVKTHKFYGAGMYKFSTWEISRQRKSDLHPTMKPVELVNNAILNSTLENQLIYDPFMGSGTTMISANSLNRRCFGIEIDPRYCAVILQRMTDAFQGIIIDKIE